MWGCCHRRGAASFSKLPLKENLSHQDRRANIKGAGNRRENLYKQCLCREEELWTWTRSIQKAEQHDRGVKSMECRAGFESWFHHLPAVWRFQYLYHLKAQFLAFPRISPNLKIDIIVQSLFLLLKKLFSVYFNSFYISDLLLYLKNLDNIVNKILFKNLSSILVYHKSFFLLILVLNHTF